jgi:uncharacterized DUF497 family protein
MGFQWDNKKAASNLEKHGISFGEATNLFNDPKQVTKPSYGGSDQERYNTVGNAFNNLLSAIWTPRGEDKRIISARKANNKETGWYDE